MKQQKFVNIFDGGMNTDSDPKALENNQYILAHNIDITGSGAFRSVSPLKGSTYINSIPEPFTTVKVLRAFETDYLISDIVTPCATLFAIFDTTYQIWACPINGTDAPVKIYEKLNVDPTEYESVDAKVYAENGITYLYFVDGVNAPGKIRCVLPLTTLLSDTEISLLKRAPLGLKISDFTVDIGGDLVCGSYSPCIRYYNNETGKVSAWTLPGLPIKVHLSPDDPTTGFHVSGRNISSQKKIVFNIEFSNSTEKGLYTHYQIGIIENIDTDKPAQIMSVLPPVELPAEDENTYEYKSNFRVNTTTIDEVTIEPAPIKTAKTLEIKDNRLFLGNVTYKKLEYDNGTPRINASLGIPPFDVNNVVAKVGPTEESPNWYTNDTLASKWVGYFRGEVYRFAISYYDENYNFSAPQPLDLSTVSGNRISGTLTDMKFPSRHDTGYNLLNNSHNPVALGLQLANLNNHPSWACGFVILRAKRKENIIGQSPFIPSTKLEPTMAVWEFPTRPVLATRTSTGVYEHAITEYLDAQPAENPVGITLPKNMLRSIPTDIVRYGLTEYFGLGTEVVKFSPAESTNRWMFFNPGSMFQSQTGTFLDPYVLKSGDKLVTVDVVKQRRSTRNYGETDISGITYGEYIDTDMDTNFYSTQCTDYYSHSNTSTGWVPETRTITDYVFVDNGDKTAIFDSGERIEDYESIMETKVPDGVVPSAMRKAYLQLKEHHVDVTWKSYSLPQTTGFNSTVPAGNIVINGSKLNFTWVGSNPASGKHGNAIPLNGSDVLTNPIYQYIEIANIERGLSDNRYGEEDAYHEYIYTGASYEFSDGQKELLRSGGNPKTNSTSGIAVYGGDCYINYVNYKVCDSHFAVSNDYLQNGGTGYHPDTVADRFKHGFYVKKGVVSFEGSRPVPYKALSQTVSCFIESKYNLDIQVRSGVHQTGEVHDNSVETPYQITGSKAETRIPYNYILQPELSFENTYKIWIPRLDSQIIRDKYRSRMVFSNQKIYQSDVEGFDVFNALSYYDLTESYGDITKLILSGDKLYAVQESAVLYVPVNASTLETADGASIRVQSDVVVGKPQYVTNVFGSQSIQSIQLGTNGFYCIDQNKGKVMIIADTAPAFISDIGMKRFFENHLSTDNLADLYIDTKSNKTYIGFGDNDNQKERYIFDNTAGKWICRLVTNDVSPNLFITAANVKDKFIVFGYDSIYQDGYLSYTAWDTTDQNTHLDQVLQPKVTFIVNPNPGQAKTFNNLIIDSTENLLSATCKVYRDSNRGDQETIPLDLTMDHRYESNYRIAILRDNTNYVLFGTQERLRGSFLEVNLQWPSEFVNVDHKLASVTTKYLESKLRS
jgi:hypothetical protein